MTNEEWTNTLNAANAAIAQVGSAVVGATADKATRNFNKEQAEVQRKWAEEQAEKANAWNYERWQESNVYNSPEQQMKRLRDAGLNPLFYGLDGNASGAMQAAAQPLGYERANATPFVNPIDTGLDAAAKAAQIANIEAATQKTKTETKATDAKLPFEVESLRNQVEGSRLDNDAKAIVNKYLDGQQQAELRVKNSSAAANDASIQKAFAEIEKMDYEKATMMISWLEIQEKILTLQKQRDLTDKQMDELASLIGLNNANAKKIGLDVSNYDDVTVIGTASHSMHMGPFSVQEGEPITLAMLKAAREHADELKKNEKKNKRSPQGQVSATDGSPYNGPIYD